MYAQSVITVEFIFILPILYFKFMCILCIYYMRIVYLLVVEHEEVDIEVGNDNYKSRDVEVEAEDIPLDETHMNIPSFIPHKYDTNTTSNITNINININTDSSSRYISSLSVDGNIYTLPIFFLQRYIIQSKLYNLIFYI